MPKSITFVVALVGTPALSLPSISLIRLMSHVHKHACLVRHVRAGWRFFTSQSIACLPRPRPPPFAKSGTKRRLND